MLVNQTMLGAYGRSTSPITDALPEFPSPNLTIENNPEFPTSDFGDFDKSQVDAQNNGKSFADLLNDAIDGVSQQDRNAVKTGLDFALGRGNIDVHQVMLEQAKAEAQLHLVSAVTNKLASSYQTLMNMQI